MIRRLVAAVTCVAVVVAASAQAGPATSSSADAQSIPAPVRRYFDAVAARDLDRLAATFAPNGVVIDVSRRIVGRRAIRAWARNEVIGGRLALLRVVSRSERRGITLLVRFTPAGSSSGFRAHYRFVVRGPSITLAHLTYA